VAVAIWLLVAIPAAAQQPAPAMHVRGAARHSGKAGANSFRLTGRSGGRSLKAAVYRLQVSARDRQGNTSATRRSAGFRIVGR